jgi:Xaa-Pro aminopeptidase
MNVKGQEVSDMEGERHHASYVPRLSLEERNRRWLEIREKMAIQGLGCLLLVGNDRFWGLGMTNMRYLTHIASQMAAMAVFPVEGEPVVWTGPPHMNTPTSIYRHTQDWVKDIRVDLGPGPVVEYLKEQKYDRGAIGLVGFGSSLVGDIIPHAVYDYFQKELPGAKIVNATYLLEQLRMIKSPEEIAMLEKAGQLARRMIETMITSAIPGKKECELFADMVHTHLSNGGEAQIFNLLTSGPVEGNEEKHLLHGAEQPASPTTRTLRKGDLIITELHANWGGYLAGAEFSVHIGKAPDQLKRIHDVSVQCLETLLKEMRVGNKYRHVWEAVRDVSDRSGLDFVELGFHGHGLASPEFPCWVYRPHAPILSGKNFADLEIRENMVFGTNIDMHDPKWKKDVGLMLGDMIYVTKNGARRLVNIPLDFLEKSV